MTLSGEKYLTAAVVIVVYIEEVGALIATLDCHWKFHRPTDPPAVPTTHPPTVN